VQFPGRKDIKVMSKSKATNESVASTLSSIGSQITSPSLTRTEREELRSRNARVPNELVEMVSHLSSVGNGSILGMPFDATTASATLSQTSATQTAISVGRQTLQRMEDDMLQQRATVADPAFAIYTALRRLVKTKAGNSLAPAYEQMKSIVKNRPRKSRAKKPEETTSNAATPPVAATPAATPPATQATAPKVVATTSN
jgi:hypothetical protein